MLSGIRVVLVEPAGPRNVGAIARVMKNMGLSQLVIVAPRCQLDDPEAIQMAVHADDTLAAATVVDTLAEAIAPCQRVMGTVGRLDVPEITPVSARGGVPWLLEVEAAAIVFGPEDRGLSNAELGLCQRWLTIPVNPDYPSLNLAQAVGICAYELRLAAENAPTQTSAAPVTQQTRAAFYGQFENLLLQIGYLYPHTAAKKMRKLQRLFDRAEPSLEEIAQLRGILGQLRWANQHFSAQQPNLNSDEGKPDKE